MSGFEDYANCPNCLGETMAKSYVDWKPYDLFERTCMKCGYHTIRAKGYLTAEELKEQRRLNVFNVESNQFDE